MFMIIRTTALVFLALYSIGEAEHDGAGAVLAEPLPAAGLLVAPKMRLRQGRNTGHTATSTYRV